MQYNIQKAKRHMDDSVNFLDLFVKNIIKVRQARDVYSRVLRPTNQMQPFAVILEKGSRCERINVPQPEVSRSLAIRCDIELAGELRSAIGRLEKHTGTTRIV